MDPIAIIEQFGVPVGMVIFLGYFIWSQNKYQQEDAKAQTQRLESILIKLISQIKAAQLDIKELKGFVNGIEDILTKLTGNGLKGKK